MLPSLLLRGVPPRAAVFLRGVPPRAPRLKAPSTRTRKKSCAIIAALDEISGPGVDLNVIETTAPGKQVLTGEYAVLAGAPALAAALDRRVMCRMTPANKGDWSFVSHGFEARATHRRDDLPDTGPAALARFALTSLDIDPRTLPAHLQIQIDSRPFYQGREKLGFGSSAACAVAVTAALAELAGTTVNLEHALATHRSFQRGAGSGVDVAASFCGGVIRYQDGRPQSTRLPSDVRHMFVFTGVGADTRALVQRFDAWRGQSSPPELRALVRSAIAVADSGTDFLDLLAEYIDALLALDRAARIGIFSAQHLRAASLAKEFGVLYKPCGAGGDMGMGVSRDPNALAAYRGGIEREGFLVVPAEISRHGLQVRLR